MAYDFGQDDDLGLWQKTEESLGGSQYKFRLIVYAVISLIVLFGVFPWMVGVVNIFSYIF